MFNKKTINDIDVRGKVVLVRTDYNVPIEYSENGEANILNDFRIKSSLPTLKNLIERGVRKIIIISHMGRPKAVEGISDLDELEHLPNGSRKYSLRPVFNHLRELLEAEDLNFPMNFHTTPIFPRTRYLIRQILQMHYCKLQEQIYLCKMVLVLFIESILQRAESQKNFQAWLDYCSKRNI